MHKKEHFIKEDYSQIIQQMTNHIKENKIYNYYDFLDYCMNSNEVWFKILIDNPSLKNYF